MSSYSLNGCQPVFLAPQFDIYASPQIPELVEATSQVAQAAGGLVLDECMLVKQPLLATEDRAELEERYADVRKLMPVHGRRVVDKFPSVLLMEQDDLIERIDYLDSMAQEAGFAFRAEDMLVRARYALLDYPVERLDVHRAIFGRFAERVEGKGNLTPGKVVNLIDISPANQIIFLGSETTRTLNPKNVAKYVSDIPTTSRRNVAVRSLIEPEVVARLGDEIVKAFEDYVDYRIQNPSSLNDCSMPAVVCY